MLRSGAEFRTSVTTGQVHRAAPTRAYLPYAAEHNIDHVSLVWGAIALLCGIALALWAVATFG
jgi:hypothetical protein